MVGFVAMQRDWHDHDLFAGETYSRRDAWSWLIAQAAYKPTKVRIKGATVELARSELCFSQRFLAEKWGWSKSKVDRFIQLLRAEGMIASRSKTGATAGHPAGHGQAIISICNYDRFQSPLKAERGSDVPQGGATAGQQRGKEEQGNKVIPFSNENGADDPDQQFWDGAKGYLGTSKASLIGKLAGEYGRQAVAEAITTAMLQSQQPPDRVSYVIGILKRRASAAEEVPIV